MKKNVSGEEFCWERNRRTSSGSPHLQSEPRVIGTKDDLSALNWFLNRKLWTNGDNIDIKILHIN